jgi:hypothetical protein
MEVRAEHENTGSRTICSCTASCEMGTRLAAVASTPSGQVESPTHISQTTSLGEAIHYTRICSFVMNHEEEAQREGERDLC